MQGGHTGIAQNAGCGSGHRAQGPGQTAGFGTHRICRGQQRTGRGQHTRRGRQQRARGVGQQTGFGKGHTVGLAIGQQAGHTGQQFLRGGQGFSGLIAKGHGIGGHGRLGRGQYTGLGHGNGHACGGQQ